MHIKDTISRSMGKRTVVIGMRNKLLYLIFFLNTTAPSQKGHRWQTLLSYKSMLQCFMVAKKKVGRGKKWVAFFQASSHLHSLEMAYISTNQERPLKAWYILSLHICKQTQPFKKKKKKDTTLLKHFPQKKNKSSLRWTS